MLKNLLSSSLPCWTSWALDTYPCPRRRGNHIQVPENTRCERLTVEDGRSHNNVWGMAQDERGLMLFSDLEIISRIARKAPDLAAGLKDFVENSHMAELRDLLEEVNNHAEKK